MEGLSTDDFMELSQEDYEEYKPVPKRFTF